MTRPIREITEVGHALFLLHEAHGRMILADRELARRASKKLKSDAICQLTSDAIASIRYASRMLDSLHAGKYQAYAD